MIVAWILSSRALAPLQQLIAQWKTVVSARDAYARLDKLLGATTRPRRGHAAAAAQGRADRRSASSPRRPAPRSRSCAA